jgi:Tol biopolymer transport system component
MLINPDGSNRRVIFEDPTRIALAPVWSPTGDRIAFGLSAFLPLVVRACRRTSRTIAPDGTGLGMLTTGEGNYGFPSWSPHGKRIVALAGAPGSKGLVILDVATGAITPLTSGPQTDRQLRGLVVDTGSHSLHERSRRRLGALHHSSRWARSEMPHAFSNHGRAWPLINGTCQVPHLPPSSTVYAMREPSGENTGLILFSPSRVS